MTPPTPATQKLATLQCGPQSASARVMTRLPTALKRLDIRGAVESLCKAERTPSYGLNITTAVALPSHKSAAEATKLTNRTTESQLDTKKTNIDPNIPTVTATILLDQQMKQQTLVLKYLQKKGSSFRSHCTSLNYGWTDEVLHASSIAPRRHRVRADNGQ